MKNKLLILLILISGNIPNFAQQKGAFTMDLHTFLDNREYYNSVQYAQTIIGFRANPNFQYTIDSVHQLNAGINALQEFGTKFDPNQLQLVVNYRFFKNGKTIFMGIFPRKKILKNYPLALLTDTLTYFRPNLQGLFTQSEKKWGKINLWVDWTSRQADDVKEQFLFGMEGVLRHRNIFWETFIAAHHDAGARIPKPTDSLRDNAGLISRLGFDASNKTFLDSLVVRAGYMQSYERSRAANLLRTPKGFHADAHLTYKFVTFHFTFYRGEGSNLDYGDHFFRAKKYSRADIILIPFKNKKVSSQFVWSFHEIENHLENQQKFQVYVNI